MDIKSYIRNPKLPLLNIQQTPDTEDFPNRTGTTTSSTLTVEDRKLKEF